MKASITVALESVLKVYASCKTTKQYCIANKYRSLFVHMYVYNLKQEDCLFTLFVQEQLADTQTNCLNNIIHGTKS